MFTPVSEYDFRASFIIHDRKDQFSFKALEALFSYITELEDDLGEQIQLDIEALCCEWTEYKSAIEAIEDYGTDEFENENDAIEWFQDRTQVIKFDGGILISF